MSSAIPPEIISDILVRLPVKPLLRFRSVSKPWYALIDSPHFIKRHLKRSIITKSNLSLYIGSDGNLYSLDYYTLGTPIRVEVLLEDFKVDDIVGSCNELLLHRKHFFSDPAMGNEIVLFNPATRHYRVIPDHQIEYPSGQDRQVSYAFENFGLGYDSVSDDYKVIRVVQFKDEDFRWIESETKIYSLKTNSWGKVENFSFFWSHKRVWGVHLNSHLHTAVNTAGRGIPDLPNIIAAFDLSTEKCDYIPLPNGMDKRYCTVTVEVFEKMPCVQASYDGHRTDIWVMREYGVNESWFKLLSICPPFVEPQTTIHPLALSNNGEEVLLYCNGERLIWYNLERKSIKSASFRGRYNPYLVEVCVDSLILLDGVA